MAELTEAVAEAAETVAREAETVATVSRSISGRDFGLGFFSGGFLSGLITLILSKRHYQLKFEKIANEEIAEMREHYWAKEKAESQKARRSVDFHPNVKPPLEEIVVEQGYVPPEPGGPNVAPTQSRLVKPPGVVHEKPSTKAEEIVQQKKSIFNPETGDEWNYEYELSQRSIDKPYVINRDEYAEQNSEYTGVTLTYYTSDDVLCDESGKPIENAETLVGKENLKFGHGSGDRNVVYVRNEVLSVDMEVLRNPGSYAEEVLLGRDQNRQYGTE